MVRSDISKAITEEFHGTYPDYVATKTPGSADISHTFVHAYHAVCYIRNSILLQKGEVYQASAQTTKQFAEKLTKPYNTTELGYHSIRKKSRLIIPAESFVDDMK